MKKRRSAVKARLVVVFYGAWLRRCGVVLVSVGILFGTKPLVRQFSPYVPFIDNYLHQMRFDSKKWKARSADDGFLWPTRLRMIDDLLASERLKGKTQKEVITVLGLPDEGAAMDNPELTYFLGPERGFIRIDSEALIISLDTKRRVAGVEIFRD